MFSCRLTLCSVVHNCLVNCRLKSCSVDHYCSFSVVFYGRSFGVTRAIDVCFITMASMFNPQDGGYDTISTRHQNDQYNDHDTTQEDNGLPLHW